VETDKPPPRVSVCIPVWRGERHLAAAIASVLAQRFTDFELIVIDDASPDASAEAVAAFSDPRLRYLRNERNLGAEGAWNRGLALARGRYFKLLPQDDLLRPDALARQVAALDADADERIALAFSARQVLAPDGRALMRRGYPQAAAGRIEATALARRCLRRGTNLIGEPGAVLCRTALLRRIGGFDGRRPYVIDLDAWLRLLAFGAAWYEPEPLASFRISLGSWSVALAAQQSADFRALMAGSPQLQRASALDRLCGRWAPGLNQMLRRAFYRQLST
jgi:glycosyltransferase involved in cell wall biosynthesis